MLDKETTPKPKAVINLIEQGLVLADEQKLPSVAVHLEQALAALQILQADS